MVFKKTAQTKSRNAKITLEKPKKHELLPSYCHSYCQKVRVQRAL